MLWRSSPLGETVAVVWVALAGIVCVFLTTSSGNILYAARVVLLESGTWSLEGPMLGVQSASFTEGATYYGYLDKVTFWIPGIVAVRADRRRGAGGTFRLKWQTRFVWFGRCRWAVDG